MKEGVNLVNSNQNNLVSEFYSPDFGAEIEVNDDFAFKIQLQNDQQFLLISQSTEERDLIVLLLREFCASCLK